MTVYRKKNYTQGHLRNEIVHRLNCESKDYRTICSELWIGSLWTISRRANRDTLESKSSAPHNPNRKYEFEELYFLYAVKKYMELPLDDCIDMLKEEYDIEIKRSSASYYLNQWELTKKLKLKEEHKKFKDYDVWYIHIDITYWPKINWKKMYIYVAIDRKTRLIYIELHDNKKAETAGKFLNNVIEFMPFEIHTILTDNGKEFTLKNHKWKHNLIWIFDKICNEFEIEHRTTLPYTPKTNGMVEKCNDTIKTNTVEKTIYETMIEMERDLIGFMLYYNLNRRHWWIMKEIRKRTPYEALEYYYWIKPELFKEPPEKFKIRLENISEKHNVPIQLKRKM